MKANHIHLVARDVAASKGFYTSWLGLGEDRNSGHIVFLTDEGGFDLAISHDPAPAPLPSWFHFGFKTRSAEEVMSLCQRMQRAGVAMDGDLYESPDRVAFFCHDPDGHLLEVYWEKAAGSGH